MPVWLLQVITAVSASGGIGATGAALYYRVKLHNQEWRHEQDMKGAKHGGSFYRCPYHHHTGMYNAAEPHQRIDLTEIGERNRKLYENRPD